LLDKRNPNILYLQKITMRHKKLIASTLSLLVLTAPVFPAKAQLGPISPGTFSGSGVFDDGVEAFGLTEDVFGSSSTFSLGNILSLGSSLGSAFGIPGIGKLSSIGGSLAGLAGINTGAGGLSPEDLELANKASSLFSDFYKGIKSNDILGSIIKGGQGILGIINPQEAQQSILADGAESLPGGNSGLPSAGKMPSTAEAETPEQVLWIYRAAENVGSQSRGSISNSILGPEGQKVISNQIQQSALNSDVSQKALESMADYGESSVKISEGIAELATSSRKIAAAGKGERSSQGVLKKILESMAIASNQTAGSATLQVVGVAAQVQAAKQARAQHAELVTANDQLRNLQFAAAANLDANNDAVFTAKRQLEYQHNEDSMTLTYATQSTGSWIIPGMAGD
jgi:hypothetical protein